MISKFMMIKQLFHVNDVLNKFKSTYLKGTYGLFFGQNKRVTILSTFHLTVSGIIIQSLISIGHL